MTCRVEEPAAANGVDGSTDVAQHEIEQNFRQSKRNQTGLRMALAAAQQEAAVARQRLDELRATLLDLRQERDAWNEQAQRLALGEKPTTQRPAWWQCGTGG